MKQVFCVQSHITFLIAKAIIQEKEFDEDNVIFIIIRSYIHKDLERFRKIDLSVEHDNITQKTSVQKILSHKSSCNRIDNKIKNEIGDFFEVYLPLIRHHFFQILATNEFCRTINMLEEGVSAYAPNMISLGSESFLKKIFKRVFNIISRIFKYRMFFTSHYDISCLKNTKDSIFYCLSDKAFSTISNPKSILDLSKNINSTCRRKFKLKSNTILVLEGAVEQMNLSLNVLLEGINEILKHIEDHTIYVKYHPVQSKENICQIRNIFKKHHITILEIPRHIAFEDVLLDNKGLHVYGFSSSLLLYSKLLGSSPFVFEEVLFKDSIYRNFRLRNNYDIRKLIN